MKESEKHKKLFQDYDVEWFRRAAKGEAEELRRSRGNNEILFWIMNWNVDCYLATTATVAATAAAAAPVLKRFSGADMYANHF